MTTTDNTSTIDIDELLAKRREIAIIWSIEDMQDVRLDLTEEQAWQVLQEVKQNHDANFGIKWLTLELTADDLFGDAPDTDKDGTEETQ